MHSVLFAGPGARAATFASILASEGYGTQHRVATTTLTDDDLRAAEGSAIVFLDQQLGPDIAGRMVQQLRACPAIGRNPLVALIGEPQRDSFDHLIACGVDLYVTDNPQTLAFRTRFLRGALQRRQQLAQAMADVRVSEAKYRGVIAVLREGIVVRDQTGAIRTINDSAMQLLGLTRSAAVLSQEPLLRREDGTLLAREETPGIRALDGEELFDRLVGVTRADGETAWLSLNASPLRDPSTGDVTGSVTSMTDISARRRAEDEFLEILDRAPAIVLIHRDEKILWVNRSLLVQLGYTDRSQLIGRPAIDLIPTRHVPMIAERIRQRSAGADGPPLQHALLRADGSEIEVEAFGMPTMFRGAPAVIVYGRDLTEQRRLEGQLISSDRLAALGRLAASVGHEINNPLTYLIGNLELAMRRLRAAGDGSSVASLLADALEGADRVRRIVDDLRVFARRRTEEDTEVDLASVIASCVRMTQGEIRHRAQLTIDVAGIPVVHGNEARLAQVITNLLLNAAQSIPDDVPERNQITVSGRVRADGRVEIRVRDTGAGIDPEHVAHVFEPFFTTKLNRGGTGLGLSITRTLVHAMGGEITLTSETGRGTEVTVILRTTPSTPAASVVAEVPAIPTRRRVLLVEDEPKIAEVLRENLAPHDVTIASNGDAAITLLANDSAFDVIVCDLMMPGISGIEVHEHLRANLPGLERRIVFMTGGAFTARASTFLANVGNPCLEKPFAIQSLFRAIDEIAAAEPLSPDTRAARTRYRA